MAKRAECSICGRFIGNFDKDEDADNAVTMHEALHAQKEADQLPPPDPKNRR